MKFLISIDYSLKLDAEDNLLAEDDWGIHLGVLNTVCKIVSTSSP